MTVLPCIHISFLKCRICSSSVFRGFPVLTSCLWKTLSKVLFSSSAHFTLCCSMLCFSVAITSYSLRALMNIEWSLKDIPKYQRTDTEMVIIMVQSGDAAQLVGRLTSYQSVVSKNTIKGSHIFFELGNLTSLYRLLPGTYWSVILKK